MDPLLLWLLMLGQLGGVAGARRDSRVSAMVEEADVLRESMEVEDLKKMEAVQRSYMGMYADADGPVDTGMDLDVDGLSALLHHLDTIGYTTTDAVTWETHLKRKPSPKGKIYIMLVDNWHYMYLPLINTVQRGLLAFSVNTTVVKRGRPTLHEDIKAMIHNSSNPISLNKGDTFIWVGEYDDHVPWATLTKADIYTIHYDLDPVETRHKRCGKLSFLLADEIWEYSHSNIDLLHHLCSRSNDRTPFPLMRFLPAAFDPDAFPIHQKNNPGSKAVFFGGVKYGRRRCWKSLIQEPLLTGKLRDEYHVWSKKQFIRFATNDTTSGVFLNIHKTCINTPSTPAEPRIAQLLSHGGIIVSQPIYHKDMESYSGLVDFVPISEFPRVVSKWLSMSAEERQTKADERKRIFQARNSPKEVILRSGVLETFGVLESFG